MALTKQEIKQIAKLARLELTEEEILMYAEQLSSVLKYMDMLSEVKTENVENTSQVTGLMDVTRADIARPRDEIIRQKLISDFPDRLGNVLRVKKVFEE